MHRQDLLVALEFGEIAQRIAKLAVVAGELKAKE
jgi:hypothetical protein